MLISDWNWSAKNAPKPFLKCLKDRIRKIKQYLDYILMLINQNTLSNPKDIIKSAKKFMKNFTPRRQLLKLHNRKKICNE